MDQQEGPSINAAAPTMNWTDQTLASVAENLALDEALLIEADEGRAGASLRLWESPEFAVVLGASRRLAQDVLVDHCRADGVPIVRRSSGGGTVVIGPGALNVTVVLPETLAPGLSAVHAAQEFVLKTLAAALAGAGRPVELRGSGDLTWDDRKFGGSAQRRLRRWFLVHCSILLEFPLERVSRYLRTPDRQPGYRRGRPHDEFLRNLEIPRGRASELIRSTWSPSFLLSPMTVLPQALLENLLAERFANRSWIERL